jgi:threonine dehydrogenase-like Zn-dependent dehydrogenase
MMKAVHIVEAGKVSVLRLDKPVAEAGELLLRLRYVGFCGSDLSTYLGKNPMVEYPRIPGHEISALIEEVGTGVPEDFSVGEAVTVVPYTSCGECPSCLRERSNACQFNKTLGVQRDGAMQEYLALPWQKVLKAPGLGERELAMVEPLTVGFHAIERGRVSDSDVVMVLGCGMIGAGAIVSAVQKGATVLAVDIDDYKLKLASVLGAHYTINSRSVELHKELEKHTGGRGPDVVVEAAGNPLTYRTAVEEVAFTGRVVCIGYAGIDVAFATKLFVQKEMDILGSRNATSEDFKNVITYLEKGTFPMEAMLSRVLKVEEAGEAMKAWSMDPGKVMKMLVEFKS